MSDKVYTVSQLNRYIKQRFEDDIILRGIMVSGEISNFKVHSSGHCYFSLKDKDATIRCISFRSSAMRFKFAPQNGMKVIIKGYVSVYERDGAYQLYAQTMTPEGIGELALAYEQLKEALAAEGIFAPEHKQPLPQHPRKIGVVTSRTGAVIRDICHVAGVRNPQVQIILYSVEVQGEKAAQQIAEGIKFFNHEYPVDTIIVGRGGGSTEDLWAFNEEVVVRAVYNSQIPIISAVGHETDNSLSDLASDQRAATPSQAAELAVPELTGQINYIKNLEKILVTRSQEILGRKQRNYELIKQNSVLEYPERLLITRQQRIDLLSEKLVNLQNQLLNDKKSELTILIEKLEALNPVNTLKRGYSVVFKDKKLLKSVNDTAIGDEIKINLADGKLMATVKDIEML